jgi:hypothetical protein
MMSSRGPKGIESQTKGVSTMGSTITSSPQYRGGKTEYEMLSSLAFVTRGERRDSRAQGRWSNGLVEGAAQLVPTDVLFTYWG